MCCKRMWTRQPAKIISSNKILVSLHWPSPPESLRAPPKAIIRTWCQNQSTTLCQVNKCPLNLEGWRWDTSGNSSWWWGRWILVLHDKLPRYLSLLVSMLKLGVLTTAVEIFDFRWEKNVTQVLRRVSYTYYGYQASWEKDSCNIFFFQFKKQVLLCMCCICIYFCTCQYRVSGGLEKEWRDT